MHCVEIVQIFSLMYIYTVHFGGLHLRLTAENRTENYAPYDGGQGVEGVKKI